MNDFRLFFAAYAGLDASTTSARIGSRMRIAWLSFLSLNLSYQVVWALHFWSNPYIGLVEVPFGAALLLLIDFCFALALLKSLHLLSSRFGWESTRDWFCNACEAFTAVLAAAALQSYHLPEIINVVIVESRNRIFRAIDEIGKRVAAKIDRWFPARVSPSEIDDDLGQ